MMLCGASASRASEKVPLGRRHILPTAALLRAWLQNSHPWPLGQSTKLHFGRRGIVYLAALALAAAGLSTEGYPVEGATAEESTAEEMTAEFSAAEWLSEKPFPEEPSSEAEGKPSITGFFSSWRNSDAGEEEETLPSDPGTEISDWTVSGLKAVSTDEGVELSWDELPEAEGYIIGRRSGKEETGQIGYTANTFYKDENASMTAYSYYWVLPYKKEADGSIVRGSAPEKAVYGIKRLPEVQNLQAEGAEGAVVLSWDALDGADGYRIGVQYGDGLMQKLADTVQTEYTDTQARVGETGVYQVTAFRKIKGAKRAGMPGKTAEAQALPIVTESMEAALERAQAILEYGDFSGKGLQEQLTAEGFSQEDAAYAAKALETDWTAKAAGKAASYLLLHSFSREGLISQLMYEGFSLEEAIAGADALNVDWNAQAVSKAEALLSRQAYSRDGLAKALEEEGFTAPEGAYGADNVGTDWNAQAARKAQSYLQLRDLSKAQMRRQLNYDGFTQEQIDAALSAAGY